jgi:hypothetical protein
MAMMGIFEQRRTDFHVEWIKARNFFGMICFILVLRNRFFIKDSTCCVGISKLTCCVGTSGRDTIYYPVEEVSVECPSVHVRNLSQIPIHNKK